MAIKLNDFYATDDELQEGEWHELECGLPVLIAKANNSRFVNRLDALRKPYVDRARGKSLKVELERKLTRKAASEYVLLDWKGKVELPDGRELEYSTENAALIMEMFPSIAEEITSVATALEERDLSKKDEGKKAQSGS